MIYGWMHGNGKTPLYVYQNKGESWGVTEDIRKATHFPDKQACADHYLSKCAFPEEFEENITNGHLHFMDNKGQLLIT